MSGVQCKLNGILPEASITSTDIIMKTIDQNDQLDVNSMVKVKLRQSWAAARIIWEKYEKMTGV